MDRNLNHQFHIGTSISLLKEVCNSLHGGSSGGDIIWIRDVDDDPLDCPKTEAFTQQDVLLAVGNATTAQIRGGMVVYTIGGGDISGGTTGGEDVRPPSPKHYIPIYCDSSNVRYFSGGGAET